MIRVLFSKEVCFIVPNYAGLILTGREIRRQPLSGLTSPFCKHSQKKCQSFKSFVINKSGDAILVKIAECP